MRSWDTSVYKGRFGRLPKGLLERLVHLALVGTLVGSDRDSGVHGKLSIYR